MKNVIKRDCRELNNIFQDEFDKILSQQSTDVRLFNHITESSELNGKIRFQNILISPFRSAMFWNISVGIHRYSALIYDVIKSNLTLV